MASDNEDKEELRGIRPCATVKEIVAKAREKSRLEADRAMALAVDETRRSRTQSR